MSSMKERKVDLFKGSQQCLSPAIRRAHRFPYMGDYG